jgi:hypothetical protein
MAITVAKGYFLTSDIMLSKVHEMAQPEHESKTQNMQDPPSGFP